MVYTKFIMKNLTPNQLKSLSEFLNTLAATWFSAGVISPFFIKSEDIIKTVALGLTAIGLSLGLLSLSLSTIRKVKL